MDEFRIGLIGCGGIAHRHINGYRAVAHDLGTVVAGCDPNTETLNKFSDQYELPHRFDNTKDLIESGEVNVIALLTPPAVRADVIFPAIEKGIHILVEKPFAENLADAESFVQAAEQAGTVLAVNQQLRFMPDVIALRDIIESDEIGSPRVITHDQFQNRTQFGGWRTQEQRLEISIFSIHLLDRIRSLMGKSPTAVSAVTRAWSSFAKGETLTALTIQFEDECVGTMVSNWHALTQTECRLRVDGTKGSAQSLKGLVVHDPATLTVQSLNGDLRTIDCSEENAFVNAMGKSMNHLLHAARMGTQPPHNGRDNLETMQIVDAAYLSAERGGALVTIEEVKNMK